MSWAQAQPTDWFPAPGPINREPKLELVGARCACAPGANLFVTNNGSIWRHLATGAL